MQKVEDKKEFLKNSQNVPETRVLESLFNKDAGLRPANLLKMDTSTGVFLWILRNF